MQKAIQTVTNVRESNLIRSGTIANVYHYRFFFHLLLAPRSNLHTQKMQEKCI